MTETSTAKTCPVCNKDDSIQRLTAIVASGTSSGTYSGPSGGVTHVGGEVGSYGGYTTLSGTSMSNLARALAFPAEPKYPMVYNPVYFWILVVVSVVAGLATLGVGLVLFFFTWMYISSTSQIVIGNADAEFAKFGKKLAEWKLARVYWLTLYYCHKDGIVFDPASREQVQPDQSAALAYRHIEQVPIDTFADLNDRLKKINFIGARKKEANRLTDEFIARYRTR